MLTILPPSHDEAEDTTPLSKVEVAVGIFTGVCDNLLTQHNLSAGALIADPKFKDAQTLLRTMIGKVMADECQNDWFFANRKKLIPKSPFQG